MSEAENILNLAKAREILLIDEASYMPRAAAGQRMHTLDSIESLIDDALVRCSEPPAEIADDADTVTRNAADYIRSRQGVAAPIEQGKEAYARLKSILDANSCLGQAAEIVSWMRLTQENDDVGESSCHDAEAAVELFSQRLQTLPEMQEWIAPHDLSGMGEADRRNVEITRKDLRAAALFDEDFVSAQSYANTESESAWEEARPKNDFAGWLPCFEKVVDFSRREASLLAKEFLVSPYQALLDAYNPDLSNDTVNTLFAELKQKLPPLISQVMQQQAKEPPPLVLPPVAIDIQQRIATRVMRDLGLDEDHMRLDISAHPFSCGQWDDLRITTRYDENDILPSILAVVHEAGHALYSYGLPRAWEGQPVGEAESMWIHESQSLFWEMQVGCSREFMHYLSRVMKEELAKDGIDTSGGTFEPENLYRLLTRVQPSLIRVDADALTYPLHVILRHELEQKIIDGSLSPKDLPQAWNSAMKQYLGVDVPDDARGCMQDTHWSDGTFGYFPAYTFGALAAAQMMEKAKQDIPGIREHIRNGNFTPIRQWLGEHVHQHGSLYSGEELIRRATDKPLSTEAWLKQAEECYLPGNARQP